MVLWIIALIIVAIRLAHTSLRNDLYMTYRDAGGDWLQGIPLYGTHRGFIYTPLVAALFSPFALVPPLIGAVIWRILCLVAFLGAAVWWLRSRLHENVTPKQWGIALLLLFPLGIGNLNNGQVNPLIIGLLMIALVAIFSKRWTLAALCIAITAYFKVYPLSIGLLLALLFPQKFAWRLLLLLVLLGALSLVLQHPSFVLDEYQRWWQSRKSDDRRYQINIAPRDFWMLARALHLPISETVYTVLQLAAGAGIAILCWIGKSRGWSTKRLLVAILTLGCCWMLLFGPSTESATYVVLAPALVLALLNAQNQPIWMRTLVWIVYAILVVALGINSFLHLKKDIYIMSVQPLAALLFTGYALVWISRDRFWSAQVR